MDTPTPFTPPIDPPQRDPFPHLPHDSTEAEAQLHAAQHARASLRRGQYQGKITCVFGVAKSASRRFASMLAMLNDDPARRRVIRSVSYAQRFRAFELRPETALECPRGGVLHNQAAPNPPTLAAMHTLGTPYVITLRHPADQICAYACYMRYLAYQKVCSDHGIELGADLVPDQWHEKREAMNTGHFIRHSLHRTLMFMTTWINWHHHGNDVGRPNGTITTFEKFVADPADCLSESFHALHGRAPHPQRLTAAMQKFSRSDAELHRHDLPGVYPYGDTGRAGIWREDFDAPTAELYRQITSAFDALHPFANALDAYYPDWRDPNSSRCDI